MELKWNLNKYHLDECSPLFKDTTLVSYDDTALKGAI